MNYNIMFFICILFLSTHTMAQEIEAQTESSDTIALVEAYFQDKPLTYNNKSRPEDDFPLPVLSLDELNLPLQYTAYELWIWDFYIPSKQNLVAINYEYRKFGGNIAYAVQYGSHYKYSVSILYEVVPHSICTTGEIESQIEHFQSEDGVYVVPVDGEVVTVSQYFSENCGIPGSYKKAILFGAISLVLVIFGIQWQMLNRRSKLKRNAKK